GAARTFSSRHSSTVWGSRGADSSAWAAAAAAPSRPATRPRRRPAASDATFMQAILSNFRAALLVAPEPAREQAARLRPRLRVRLDARLGEGRLARHDRELAQLVATEGMDAQTGARALAREQRIERRCMAHPQAIHRDQEVARREAAGVAGPAVRDARDAHAAVAIDRPQAEP